MCPSCWMTTLSTSACEAALDQIRSKRYDERLCSEGRERITAFGITFCKKRCRVASEMLYWFTQLSVTGGIQRGMRRVCTAHAPAYPTFLNLCRSTVQHWSKSVCEMHHDSNAQSQFLRSLLFGTAKKRSLRCMFIRTPLLCASCSWVNWPNSSHRSLRLRTDRSHGAWLQKSVIYTCLFTVWRLFAIILIRIGSLCVFGNIIFSLCWQKPPDGL